LLGARLTSVLLFYSPFWRSGGVAILLVLAAVALVAAAAWSGPAVYRKSAAFIGLLLVSALIFSEVQTKTGVWETLTSLTNSDRYFIAPVLVWFSTLLVLRQSRNKVLRATSIALTVLAFSGMVLDQRYPPYIPTGFTDLAQRFAAAKPGTTIIFPENPPPVWSMTLTKHGP
jgi:hypothetical protein